MRPLTMEAAIALVELLGAPEHAPQTGLIRNFETYDNPTHPLQALTDEEMWSTDQCDALREHFYHPRFQGNEAWKAAWAYAIFRASWY